MNKLEDGLSKRMQEIESLGKEIYDLEKDAEGLKEAVKKYGDLKQKQSELKKLKKKKQHALDLVVEFFNEADEHYLDKSFPLFKDNQEDNTREDAA